MARGDQVAKAAQSVKGLLLGPQRLPHPHHFGQCPREQRGLGIVAQFQAVAEAGGDGVDVLEASPVFRPGEIITDINPQRRTADRHLHLFHELVGAGRRHDHGRRQAAGDLAGVGRAGQRAAVHPGQHLRHDLARAQMGAGLETLDETEEELQPGSVVQHRAHLFAPGPQGLRRAGNERHVGLDQRGAKIRRDNQRIGQPDSGQVVTVFAGGLHLPGMLGPADDQGRVLVAPRQMRGDRRTPRPRANDRKIEGALLGHGVTFRF